MTGFYSSFTNSTVDWIAHQSTLPTETELNSTQFILVHVVKRFRNVFFVYFSTKML